VKGYLLIKKN